MSPSVLLVCRDGSVARRAATSLAHLATVEGRPDDAEAAVDLAARYLNPDEVTVLRAMLLYRAGGRVTELDVLEWAEQSNGR